MKSSTCDVEAAFSTMSRENPGETEQSLGLTWVTCRFVKEKEKCCIELSFGVVLWGSGRK